MTLAREVTHQDVGPPVGRPPPSDAGPTPPPALLTSTTSPMIDVPPDNYLLVMLKQSYYDAIGYVGGSGNGALIALGKIPVDKFGNWLKTQTV